MKELLEKSDASKETFGVVMRELLNRSNEINSSEAKVARLEAVLKVKEELEQKHDAVLKVERIEAREANTALEKARELERKEAKEDRREMKEAMMEASEAQAALVVLLREERKENQAQQKLPMEERKENQAKQKLLMEERKEERKEAQQRQDSLMARLFEQQGERQQHQQHTQQQHQQQLDPQQHQQQLLLPPANAATRDDRNRSAGLKEATDAAEESVVQQKQHQQQQQQQQNQLLPPVNAPAPEYSDRSATTDDLDSNVMVVPPQRAAIGLTASAIDQNVVSNKKVVAFKVYATRTNKVATNRANIQSVVNKNPQFFAPILQRNPQFVEMLAHMHVLRFGFRVQEVSWTKDMTTWDTEDNRRVGRAMAPILRMVQTNDAAVDAWRSNYPQLDILFDDVTGFNEFMLVIVSGLLRDNKYGMLFRVR